MSDLLKLSQTKGTIHFFLDVPRFLNTLKDYIKNLILKIKYETRI